jgi:hypothetical protein
MFSPAQVIDAVQNGKRQFVEVFVQEPTLRAELLKLIDAQTAFAKATSESALNVATTFVKSTIPNPNNK